MSLTSVSDTVASAAPTPPVVVRLGRQTAAGVASLARRPAVLWGAAGLLGSLVAFSVVVAILGAGPISVYSTMARSAVLDHGAFAQTLLRAIPISLAALAVAVPARAGLVNVGGEGQLIVGAVAATGVGLAVDTHLPGPASWLAMAVAGTVAGAVWAGIAGLLRAVLSANESVSTLLLNFVANDVMLYLIYQPWKDPHGSGQPESRPLAHKAVLPKIFGSQANLGVIVAAVVALVIWQVLRRSSWGFSLRVAGGNARAAQRAGLPVRRLIVSSMMVGGALAGLGGALNFAGVETQLRPGITASYGYVAFLASYLARHHPIRVVLAAVVFSAIALAGNGLQLTEGLDGNIVDVLLALIVFAPLVVARKVGRST